MQSHLSHRRYLEFGDARHAVGGKINAGPQNSVEAQLDATRRAIYDRSRDITRALDTAEEEGRREAAAARRALRGAPTAPGALLPCRHGVVSPKQERNRTAATTASSASPRRTCAASLTVGSDAPLGSAWTPRGAQDGGSDVLVVEYSQLDSERDVAATARATQDFPQATQSHHRTVSRAGGGGGTRSDLFRPAPPPPPSSPRAAHGSSSRPRPPSASQRGSGSHRFQSGFQAERSQTTTAIDALSHPELFSALEAQLRRRAALEAAHRRPQVGAYQTPAVFDPPPRTQVQRGGGSGRSQRRSFDDEQGRDVVVPSSDYHQAAQTACRSSVSSSCSTSATPRPDQRTILGHHLTLEPTARAALPGPKPDGSTPSGEELLSWFERSRGLPLHMALLEQDAGGNMDGYGVGGLGSSRPPQNLRDHAGNSRHGADSKGGDNVGGGEAANNPITTPRHRGKMPAFQPPPPPFSKSIYSRSPRADFTRASPRSGRHFMGIDLHTRGAQVPGPGAYFTSRRSGNGCGSGNSDAEATRNAMRRQIDEAATAAAAVVAALSADPANNAADAMGTITHTPRRHAAGTSGSAGGSTEQAGATAARTMAIAASASAMCPDRTRRAPLPLQRLNPRSATLFPELATLPRPPKVDWTAEWG